MCADFLAFTTSRMNFDIWETVNALLRPRSLEKWCGTSAGPMCMICRTDEPGTRPNPFRVQSPAVRICIRRHKDCAASPFPRMLGQRVDQKCGSLAEFAFAPQHHALFNRTRLADRDA